MTSFFSGTNVNSKNANIAEVYDDYILPSREEQKKVYLSVTVRELELFVEGELKHFIIILVF